MQANIDNEGDKEKQLTVSQKELEATKEGVALKSKALEDSKELEVCTALTIVPVYPRRRCAISVSHGPVISPRGALENKQASDSFEFPSWSR